MGTGRLKAAAVMAALVATTCTAYSQGIYVTAQGGTGGASIWSITPGGTASVLATLGGGAFGPGGLAFDNSCNLYAIRHLIPDIVTVAASGTVTGFANDSYGVDMPVDLTCDSAGNVYVCQPGSLQPQPTEPYTYGCVDKYTTAGLQTIFASGSSGGLAVTEGMAFDRAGNLYVASAGGISTIIKFTPDGTASVFANCATYAPCGLAVDNAGNVYVAGDDYQIHKFTSGGVASIFAQTAYEPKGLAFDTAGNLLVTEPDSSAPYSGQIEEFSRAGAESILMKGTVLGVAQWIAVRPCIPGDINGDGLVDVADYDIWAANVGKAGATWSQGDLNGDGLVDVADYDIWAADVGNTAATPEPATLSLLVLGGAAMIRRRK
jgi:hypothetical protein